MKYYSQYRSHDLFELQESLLGLSKSSRWVKLADHLPWDRIEREYNKRLRNSHNGAGNKPARMVVGALIVKHVEKLSDENTIQAIQENAYMQYLLGLEKFTEKPVFVPELFVLVRKRLDHDFFNMLTLMLAETNGSKPKKEHTNEDSNHPTAPTQIGHEHYTYDANGNPTLVENDSLNTERRMYWDEDNRLMVLSDNGKTSRYTYNVGGERIIKSHGDLEGVYVNGAPQGLTFHETEDYTIYPAPIITVTKNRFTKHYFIGDKRVASKLGVGKFSNVYGISGNNVTAGQKDYATRMMQIEKQREEYYKSLGTPPGVPTMKGATADPDNTGRGYNDIIGDLGDHSVPEGWIQHPKRNTTPGTPPGPPIQWQKPEDPDNVQPGYGYLPTDTTNVEEIFFYHSDHLGSTSYITDAKANITQFDAYLPYGELLVDEHSSSEEMPYKFNGKELDQETGLYYYGARYMTPIISLFLNTDRFREKYPFLSAYNFCKGNPIKFKDINGDSLNMNNVIMMDRLNSTNNMEQIEKDLKMITGLSISVSNGFMQYEKDINGKPIYNQGSETARNLLTKIIDGQTIEVFSTNKKSFTPNGGTQVGLSSSQINDFINNTNNLDKETLGWGMTFLHELYHTGPGGSLIDTDALYGTGGVVDAMNVIRKELNAQGKNFGQRLNYKSIIPYEGGTISYIPFDKSSLNSIEAGIAPSGTSKFIKSSAGR